MEDDETFTLILSGKVTIVAGGSDCVRVELTERQLRSLAYHAGLAVKRLDKQKVNAADRSQAPSGG